jgi:glycosyltransferase involved in cell wall biosynthesis
VSKRVAFVSRVSPEKGVHVLFEAFDRVLQRHPDAELELIGAEAHVPVDMLASISREPAVRALTPLYTSEYLNDLRARFPRVAERLRHDGGVGHAEVAEKLQRVDLLVAPSLTEAFGNGVLEAMASGLPVVATCVGGHAETVEDRRTGLLVPPGDAPALAEAIDRLLADVPTRRAMGDAARRRAVSRFSWNAIAECLMGHYRRLVPLA